jgi:hypothetical protein
VRYIVPSAGTDYVGMNADLQRIQSAHAISASNVRHECLAHRYATASVGMKSRAGPCVEPPAMQVGFQAGQMRVDQFKPATADARVALHAPPAAGIADLEADVRDFTSEIPVSA